MKSQVKKEKKEKNRYWQIR